MFGWFKKKVNNYVPKDIAEGYISSRFEDICLGVEISIPQNVECLISYKDKIYLQLQTGTHTLDETLLAELCIKQKLNKEKYLKVDFFFVNTANVETSFSYLDNIPISNNKGKQTFQVKYNCKIVDSIKFSNQILSFYSSITAKQSLHFINDFIEDKTRNYFLHKKLTSTNLSVEMQTELREKITKALALMGLRLDNFEVLINSTMIGNGKEPIVSPTNDFKFNSTQSKEEIEEVKPIVMEQMPTIEQLSTNTTQEQENTDVTYCPMCKFKVIKGSVYCHRCGQKLN